MNGEYYNVQDELKREHDAETKLQIVLVDAIYIDS
jgi:hypothetical protein